MRFTTLVILMITAFCFVSVSWGDTVIGNSQDDTEIQQIENEAQARELYILGENAYKAGKLEDAVWYWMQTLTYKPDSEYTQKQLKQAREELYKRCIAEAEKGVNSKDKLDIYIKLGLVVYLIPDKTDLPDKLKLIESKMSDKEKNALAAYKEAHEFLTKQDYACAKQSIAMAQVYAGTSVYIKNSAEMINSLKGDGPGHIHSKTGGKPDVAIPRMYEFGAEWCGPCRRMKPIIAELEREYAGRIEIIYIDTDKNPVMKQQYKITAIPVQIIFDANGNQVFRHVGGISKDELQKEFAKLGVQ